MLLSVCIKFLLLSTVLLRNCHSQETNDFLLCYNDNGIPKRCEPPSETFTLNIAPTVTSTCGLSISNTFCIREYNASESMITYTNCSYECSPAYPHPPKYMTDFYPKVPQTWWQSQSGVPEVSISIDLGAQVQIETVLFTFVSFKPSSFYIRQSNMEPFHFFSTDCLDKYNITPTVDLTLENELDILCQSITDPSPGQISFIPSLDRPSSNDSIPGLSAALYEFSTSTGIEVVLDGHSLVDGLNESDYYYALEDLSVIGKCQCNGHANVCGKNSTGHRVCECQHNTTGTNCESCSDLYNDVPWRISNGGAPFECRACSCHGRASLCLFNQTLYDTTGSGGVCVGCTNNTQGRYCDECAPYYYPRLHLSIDSPDYCQSCDCHAPGIADTGDCSRDLSNNYTIGQCYCKANVEGRACDSCRPGYFNLSISNPTGCQDCGCHPNLSSSPICHASTGVCTCKSNISGPKCTTCEDGYYLSDPYTCSPCGCNVGGSLSSTCNTLTGTCTCKTGLAGRTCSDVLDGYFFPYVDFYLYEAEFSQGTFNVSYRVQSQQGLNVPFTGAGYAFIGDALDLISFGVFVPPASGLYEVAIRYNLTGPWVSAQLRAETGNETGGVAPSICSEYSEGDSVYFTNWNSGLAQFVSQMICLRGGRSYDFVLSGFVPGSNVSSLEIDSMIILLREGEGLEALNDTSIRSEYESCLDNFRGLQSTMDRDDALNDCRNVSFVVFTQLHNGALACDCKTDGVVSNTTCSSYGGVCHCLPNMVDRTCRYCSGGTYLHPSMGCTDCDCSPYGSIRGFCNNVTGQCPCFPGVTGRSCDSCIDNHYGILSGSGCSDCGCDAGSSLSLQCADDGSCDCRDGVEGTKCDRCQDLYYGFPDCQPCNCTSTGSVSVVCNSQTGNCQCRNNTMGSTCQTCVPGTFNLQPTNPDGCQPCYCSYLTDNCISALGYVSMEVATDFSADGLDGWVITNGNVSSNNGGINVHTESVSYIVAPSEYLGNKLSSYGQYLSLNVTINDSLSMLSDGFDVKITNSEGLELVSRYTESPVLGNQILTVHFHESAGWTWAGMGLIPGLLQSVLIDLTSLQLRVSLSEDNVELLSVTLDSTGTGIGNEVDWVEQCQCPYSNYTGLSCEACSEGYTRFDDGTCQLCHCNGFSSSCDANNGTCFDCSGNTTGAYCEACLDGYYGDPPSGIPCSPCPCPLPHPEGQYSSTCHLDEAGNVNCTNCSEGHLGSQCQTCAPSFYGDPTGKFSGNSTPCTTCYCNGNIYLNDWSSCDNMTGVCLKCLFNTTGNQCQYCLDGYYGDPIEAKNCSFCGCNDFGSNGTNCNFNGQCDCMPNVTGVKCDTCLPGHYGLSSALGCQSCDCHVIGSVDSTCHDASGNCTCKAGVTGSKCDQCLFGYYNLSNKGCTMCDCSLTGSVSLQCLSDGSCVCNEGVTGTKCDQCQENYYLNSTCTSCPLCYTDLNTDVDGLRTHYQVTQINVSSIPQQNDSMMTFDAKLSHALGLVQMLNSSVSQLNASHGQLHIDVGLLHNETLIVQSVNVTGLMSDMHELQREASPLIGLATSTESVMNKIQSGLYVSMSLLMNINSSILPVIMDQAQTVIDDARRGHINRTVVEDYIEVLENQTRNITSLALMSLNQSSWSLSLANLLTSVYTSNQLRVISLNSLASLVSSMDVQATNNLTMLNISILVEDMLLNAISANLPTLPTEEYIDSFIQMVQQLQQYGSMLSSQTHNQTKQLDALNATMALFNEQYNNISNLLNLTVQYIDTYYDQLNTSYANALATNVSSQSCLSKAEGILHDLKNFNSTISNLKSQANSAMQNVGMIQELAITVTQLASNTTTQLMQVTDNLFQAKPLAEEAEILSSDLEKATTDLIANLSTLSNISGVIYNQSNFIINTTESLCADINTTLSDIDQSSSDVDLANALLVSQDVQELPNKATMLSTNATKTVGDLMLELLSTSTPDTAFIASVQSYINSVEARSTVYNITAMTEYFEIDLATNLMPKLSRLSIELYNIEDEVIRLRKIMQTLPPDCSN